MPSDVRMTDGSLCFDMGVDSSRTTTVQSAGNPHGLPRTMLAWLTNGTVRSTGITPRTGWQPLIAALALGLFQGGYLYEPQFANPYLILSIGGRIYQALVEAPFSVTDLTAKFGLANPATAPQAFFAQGEQFLVIQAGDLFGNPTPTLPLFWDGTTLRRSHGITGNLAGPNINELPAATCMVYYQGRMWYAQGSVYTAGDIVDGPSGTAPYGRNDSILKVTENPLALGGDGFRLPSQSGNITALFYTVTLDTTLGQGSLYIGTRKKIHALAVPVTRTDWIAATAANQPVQTVAQVRYGPVNDRSVAHVNGDVFYQSLEPGIRSLFLSVRYFSQWANVSLSRNELRALGFNNRALMPFASGIEFDNRLLQAILPTTTPAGVASQAIAPLDFDIISSFGPTGESKPAPAWEGIYLGLNHLQLFEGDFGGRQRAFTVIYSPDKNNIQVWEITDFARRDNGDNRITMAAEFPAYNFHKDFDLKELDGGEVWIDAVNGTVALTVEYRVDADPCWQLWHQTEFCAARSSCEDTVNPVCYPQQAYCDGYQFPVTLPKPQPGKCTMMKRPTNIGVQFQVRVTVKGWCRVRGLLVFALPKERQPYEGLKC